LPEEVIQFQLPATDTVSDPAGQMQGFSVVHLGRAAILSYKEDSGFEDNPRANWSKREGGE
jgi:hypothetical protein